MTDPNTSKKTDPVATHNARQNAAHLAWPHRTFGTLLAFLAIWQILNPGKAGTFSAWVALAVCVLWFVRCPRYIRLCATAAWLVLTILLVKLRSH